jgi:ABC-2 type transport system permease protein
MKNFAWIGAIIKVNWKNMTAHKGAFWSLVLMMCVQNLIYFSLWGIIFSRIGDMRGWGLREVAFLYGSGAMGYGLIFALFGGVNQLGHVIQEGELDMHLARPRSVLWLALMSRMRADSLGDVLTGLIMLAFIVRPPLADLPLLAILSISAGLVFGAVRLITHSLAFWGMSGDTGENGFIAFIIAATNPLNGFGTAAKLALLTIFPAGYIALLPVEIMRDFRWDYMALQLVGCFTVFAFALWFFSKGLKRYTSGNRFLIPR